MSIARASVLFLVATIGLLAARERGGRADEGACFAPTVLSLRLPEVHANVELRVRLPPPQPRFSHAQLPHRHHHETFLEHEAEVALVGVHF